MNENLPEISLLTYEIMEDTDKASVRMAEYWDKYRQEEQDLSVKEYMRVGTFIYNTSLSIEELLELTPADILEAVKDN